jgi:hypothetical protein
MRTSFAIITSTLSAAVLLSSLSASAALVIPEGEARTQKAPYSPYVGDHYPQNVYFGDTHLHTAWSADAGMAGATLTPDDAYRGGQG